MVQSFFDRLKGRGLRKFYLVRKVIDLSKPKKVEILGHTLYVNRKDNTIVKALVKGKYEPEETELYRTLIKPGDRVLDIGANIGYFTLLFARLVGPGGVVYAFEPDPDNFRLLRKNIKKNGYRNIRAFPFAVSDRTSKGNLYLNDYNMGDHRIFDSHNGRKKIPIKIKALDEFLPGLSPVFVKIDVQGSEIMAFEGMRKMLRKVTYVAAEYSPYLLDKAGFPPERMLELLREEGFSFSIDPSLYTPANEGMVNILARRA